ncbi:MAG: nuclear transport factor 2 family protein [Chlorobium sp.]|nr:MAG: nuclear transport factor 2 family protein [Chlorobium sp.]
MDTRELIEKYHNAWTSGDLAAARNFLADNLDFQGSINTFTRADDFISALSQFRQIVTGVTLLRSFFDRESAALLYDCNTATPAGVVRTAEFFTVSGNKIASIRLVFDATVLREIGKQMDEK